MSLPKSIPSNINPRVVIVGAGPAGLNAAIMLARHGVYSLIIDENSSIGGAIFRQPSRLAHASPTYDSISSRQTDQSDKTKRSATELFRTLEKYRDWITFRLETQVLGVLDQNELTVLSRGKAEQIAYSHLIISTGCYERAQPFPGWTLPGVMSVGGAQLQVKAGLVRPGKSIVLAGTGPLLLVAAKQLHMAGMSVLGVFEAGRRSHLIKNLPTLFAAPKLLKEGWECLSYLRKARIPIHYGWGILEAHGESEVCEAVLARYDENWNPDKAETLTLKADCIGVGYGFVSRTQLTELLGCGHEFNLDAGGERPIRDTWLQTTLRGVYTAGDAAGVFGSEVAQEEGKLAALGCLLELRQIDEKAATSAALPIRQNIGRLSRFRHAFDEFSRLREGLLNLPNGDTVICRCEEVSLNQLDSALERGAETLADLKMTTRIGMGDCQGKMCGSFCREYLASKCQRAQKEVGTLRPRFPLAPLPFEALLQKEEGR